jgi:hypothetical protein
MTEPMLAQLRKRANFTPMETPMKRLTIAALALALAACATPPTVYGPAGASSDIGWRQTRIEQDRYRVSFRANPDLGPTQTEDMALRRAAEITLADGFQWFRVVTRNTELVGGRRGGGTSVGVGGSTGSWGSGVGVGIGLDLSPDTRKYETQLEILLGRGEKPADPSAYDAQQIASRPR